MDEDVLTRPQLDRLPHWAQWIAQDADGVWWAYEAYPNQQETGWYENEVGRVEKVGQGEPNPDWEQSIFRVDRKAMERSRESAKG